jgi:hypothetical protein
MRVEILLTDNRGFLYECPCATVGINKFALNNTRLGIIASPPDDAHSDSKHLFPRRQ